MFDKACESFKNNNAWFGWPKSKPDMKIAEHFYKLGSNAVTEHQIKQMVDRFLSWNLPEDFNPDGGINYTKSASSLHCGPIGTNLFTATQATEMVRHILGLDNEPKSAQ